MPTGTLVTYAVELASIVDSREATLAANGMSSGPTGIVSGADRLAVRLANSSPAARPAAT